MFNNRIIKQPRVHDSPYLVGDEKLSQYIKKTLGLPADKTINIQQISSHIDTLLATARENAARIESEAAERGYAQGAARALEEARQEADALKTEAAREAARILDQAAREAEAVIAQLKSEKQAILDQLEPEIIELVIAVARKVVHQQLDTRGQEVAISLVKEALRQAGEREDITIKVNPSDYDTVAAARDDLLAAGTANSITVEKDRGVAPGGCIAETSCERIDSGIESQLKAVDDAFKEIDPTGDNKG